MNSPKVVAALGLTVVFSILLTGCGGGGSKTPPPPAGPPTIRTVILPNGALGVAYSAILSATGGTGTYTWSITGGSLPPGLSLNGSTGVISGTPTTVQAGGYPFTVQVTDAASMSATAMLSIYIEGVVSITPAVLPSGSVGVAYSQTLMASGGLPPYTWSLAGGTSLPAGLSLDPAAGVISGTPTANGPPTTFMIQVTDSESSPGIPAVGTSNFTITIMTITTASLPSGSVNVPYSGTVTVAGGISTYTWNASGLPPGLTLDPATCMGTKSLNCSIKGTPTTNGVYFANFSVTDGEKQNPATATASLTIKIGALVITTTSLPTGIEGIAYSSTLMASGGVPPYTWSLTSGSLPPGLMGPDPSTGLISGTPTATGNYAFTVQVTDSGSGSQKQTASAQFTISISAPLGNSNLSGNYVFSFSGYNNGKPVFMAGGFCVDGAGNFTNCGGGTFGVLDYNDGNGEPVDNGGNPIPQTIVSGSVYSINPDGSGTMTIMTNLPATFDFAIVVRSDNSGGSLIQSDPQAYGSGMMMTHAPLAQNDPWPLCGNYVSLGLFGLDISANARYAAAGEFQFDPNTCVDVDNGVMDVNDGGVPSSATFTGAFNQYDSSTSRGIAGFTFKSDQNHAYRNPFYLISSSDRKKNKLIVVTENVCDMKGNCVPANPTLWSALPQGSSAKFGAPKNWNNLALAGTAVTELNALDTNGAADVTAGLFVGKGAQTNTCQNQGFDAATLSFDENQGGTCNGGNCSQSQSSTGMYCIDMNTGRVTLQGFTGPFGQYPPVFYMVAGNQAFVVGTDPAVTSGYLEQQMGSPFSNGSITGIYPGGTIAPVTMNVTNGVSVLFADGNGNMNGTEYTNGPGGPNQQPFTYTYTVDNTGRAIVQQNGSTIGIAYVVSGTKFVLLPATDPNPALSIFGQ